MRKKESISVGDPIPGARHIAAQFGSPLVWIDVPVVLIEDPLGPVPGLPPGPATQGTGRRSGNANRIHSQPIRTEKETNMT